MSWLLLLTFVLYYSVVVFTHRRTTPTIQINLLDDLVIIRPLVQLRIPSYTPGRAVRRVHGYSYFPAS